MDAIFVIEVVGTFVFAMSGIMTAIESEFDLFGTLILGLVTAVGGGTIRDLLIGATPVSWMSTDLYIYIIIAAIPVAFFFFKYLHRLRKTFLLFDTVGIGTFTILGIEKSLSLGLSPTISLLMGVVSAVFGGIIRDVLSNHVPLIFRNEIYAFACFAGGLVYLALNYFSQLQESSLFIGISVVISIRLLAIRFNWNIPFKPLEKM